MEFTTKNEFDSSVTKNTKNVQFHMFYIKKCAIPHVLHTKMCNSTCSTYKNVQFHMFYIQKCAIPHVLHKKNVQFHMFYIKKMCNSTCST